tara:strand:+ start:348 stop:521 length:174 start_codon:yes stop_codon:yes gene_type:complete
MKFGVKLLSYNDQIFDAWVYRDNDILLFDTLDQANEVLLDYSKKNPKGQYIVSLYEG